jgi:hypothetical protein
MRTIDLLEDAPVLHVGVHSAGDEQKRNRVGVRRGQPGQRIRGSRADRGDRSGDLTRAPVEAIRHVRRTLLVHRRQHGDPVLVVDECINERRVAVTWYGKDVLDALGDQVLHDHLATRQLHCPSPRILASMFRNVNPMR